MFVKQYLQNLKDQFIQTWHSRCDDNRKLNYYKLYKTQFHVEKYIMAIDVDKFRTSMANFRSSVHKLMIEKGRHYDISREYRLCPYCESVIEDEYHFVIVCPLYSNIRKLYLPFCYVQYPTVEKFCNLMSTENETVIRNLAMFIHHSNKCRDVFLEGNN